MEAIKLKNVSKKYGKNIVVDIEELNIEKRQVYGLIGPNGAGKSTIMKMICGLTQSTSGEILIDDDSFNKKNRNETLKKIGSLIESPSYYENLSGYENLTIVRKLKNLKDEDVFNALEIVGLIKHKDKLVKHYSLGMKQRLGIAMAIIGIPKIIVLDEPTNGLDPKVREEIRALIRNLPLKYDTTVMVSSHALDEIERMVNKIGIIDKGKLLFQGEINEFKSKYSSFIYLRTSNNKKAVSLLNLKDMVIENDYIKIPILPDEMIAKIIYKLISENINVYRIYEKDKSLEELFIEFTERGLIE